MATTDAYTVMGALHPTRPAVRLIGGATDCGVAVDNAGVAFKADATGTISAWVMLPVIAEATNTILGFGDDNVVEFMQFHINAGLLTLTVTDATTAEVIVQADNIEFLAHTWYHVAAVQDGASPKLYVNGKVIDSTEDEDNSIGAWGSVLGGIDKGNIGVANKAGNSTETEEFKGYISSVRYYNTAKTPAQVKAIYDWERDGTGSNDTTNLRNHWKLDVGLTDSGTGADDGSAVGGALVVDAANEFASKLTYLTGTIQAADTLQDMVQIGITEKTGFAILVKEV